MTKALATLALVLTVSVAANMFVPMIQADGGNPFVPFFPTNLTATASHESVILQWDRPSEDDRISNYRIVRKVGSTKITVDTGNADLVYHDNDVTPGATHIYKVRAENIHGYSGKNSISVDVPEIPRPTSKPTKPRGLSAYASRGYVGLS